MAVSVPTSVAAPGGDAPGGGASQVDPALVAAAAARIGRVHARRPLDLAVGVGRCVLDVFFRDGSPDHRASGRGHPSFRALADRPDVPYSALWLWRAAGIAVQLGQLPDLADRLGYSHHVLLLSIDDPAQKLALARRATELRWTRDQLQDEISRQRRAGARRGRPALPPLVKTVRRIEALLGDRAVHELDGLADLPHAEQRKLHRSLRRLLRRLEAMVDELRPALVEAGPPPP